MRPLCVGFSVGEWRKCAVSCVGGLVCKPVVILLKPFLASELKH